MPTLPISELLPWGPEREIMTARGTRLLRTAPANERFWATWKTSKSALKEAGISVTRDDSGQWEVAWWREPPRATAAIAASLATRAETETPAPPGLAYLPFQKAGIEYARTRPGVLLADEMGLGKTIQALGAINAAPGTRNVLVICPASLKLNWLREARKWLVDKSLRVEIASGSSLPPADVIITNYERVARLRPAIGGRHWDFLIVDEAHALKNPTAARTKLILGKRERDGSWSQRPIKAGRRLFLTGTPILNRPLELWPLLRALDPLGLGRSYKQFTGRYCAAFACRHGIDASGASNLPELQNRLRSTCMVRRLKADVLAELPPKRRQIVVLPADSPAATAAIAAEHEATARADIAKASAQAALASAEAIKEQDPAAYAKAVAALHQCESVAFSEISACRHNTALAKVPAVTAFTTELLESASKLIIFGWHRDVVESIAAPFGSAAVVVTGDTLIPARDAAVARFQTDPTCTLFCGTIGAAGVGLTLTAASHELFAELDWTPARVTQAEDRAHRIGQEWPVNIYHLVLDGSLDQRMAEILVDKQRIADAALGTATGKGGETQPLPASESVLAPPPEPEITVPEADSIPTALTMTAVQIAAVHEGLRQLAGLCDGARKLDSMGFSKFDAALGHSLASAPGLTPRQAALGRKILHRYHRQLSPELLEAAGALHGTGA